MKVTVINSEGRAPTEEQVQSVYDYIEMVRPIGATVTVVAIKEVSVNVTAELVLLDDLIPSDIQKEIEQNIADYLAEAHTEIRYSQISRAILRTEGVKDYTNVLMGTGVDLGVTNIIVSAEDVAVVGEVMLS